MAKKEKLFDDVVKSMSAKEIIMAMVNSLIPPPAITVDMGSFGHFYMKDNEPVCYGCAATNTICKISGKVFTSEYISRTGSRALFVNASFDFLDYFEQAIDYLRQGLINNYNVYAKHVKIALISNPDNLSLPALKDDYTKEDLDAYIKLADTQP